MTSREAIARIDGHMRAHAIKEPRAIFIKEAIDNAITALELMPEVVEMAKRLLEIHSTSKELCDDPKTDRDLWREAARVNSILKPHAHLLRRIAEMEDDDGTEAD